jgi:hypothetical protein
MDVCTIQDLIIFLYLLRFIYDYSILRITIGEEFSDADQSNYKIFR